MAGPSDSQRDHSFGEGLLNFQSLEMDDTGSGIAKLVDDTSPPCKLSSLLKTWLFFRKGTHPFRAETF